MVVNLYIPIQIEPEIVTAMREIGFMPGTEDIVSFIMLNGQFNIY